MKFMGYKRSYGTVGIRNHVVVMAGVVCSQVAAQRICESAKGTTFLANNGGCAFGREDTARTIEIISGLLAHPNVHSALIVGLGCETIQRDFYLDAIEKKAPGKKILYISMQNEGGLHGTIAKGVELASQLVNEAAGCVREECDMSELMLGLECGGSDPTSGTSANVVLGEVTDRLVDMGGTAVISETSEFIGTEHIMLSRGATPEIGKAIHDAIRAKAKVFSDKGQDIRDSNPSPGNIRSGLTTLEEKSLGCVCKSGTRPFTGCVAYGELVKVKGPVFMETAAYDPISTVGEIAGGCQTVAFTTGMGNPMGCAIAPVIKITGNRQTYENMTDIIDLETGANLRGEKTVSAIADEMLAYLVEVCNGRLTKAEINGADVMVIDQHVMGV